VNHAGFKTAGNVERPLFQTKKAGSPFPSRGPTVIIWPGVRETQPHRRVTGDEEARWTVQSLELPLFCYDSRVLLMSIVCYHRCSDNRQPSEHRRRPNIPISLPRSLVGLPRGEFVTRGFNRGEELTLIRKSTIRTVSKKRSAATGTPLENFP
jgi:hypothetical protein